MTVVLLAVACAVSWWPATRAERRLGWRAQRRTASSRSREVTIGCASPVVALVVFGVSTAIATGLITATLLWRWRRGVRIREEEARTADLLLALSVMVAELSVGAPPARASAAAARELGATRPDSPVVHGLATMSARAELGGEVVVDGDDDLGTSWRRVGVAWQMADRYGLPMVDLLGSVRADLLARRAFSTRTRAGLAGPRATAAVLAGLPVLGILLGQAMGAHPLRVLLGPGIGGALLVTGTVLSMVGLVWSERITDRAVRR